MKPLTKTTTALLSGAALMILSAAALPSLANAGTCSDAKTDGAVIGGVAGAALGNSVSGHNRGAGTLIGGLLGAVVGSEVGGSSQSCTYYQPRPVAYAPPPAPVYVERTRWDGEQGGIYPQFAGREDHIRREIVDAARDQAISWDDAHMLMGRLGQVQAEERREYDFHGWDLPYDDQARIAGQLDRLDRRVDWMRDNG